MSLADWQTNGCLMPHQTSAREIADLLAVVERDLADSAAKNLSADWRMNIAYNAALQAATAALAAAGYRASGDQHHYRIIHSLRETIGAASALVATFDAFRKKRNITGYERVGFETIIQNCTRRMSKRGGTRTPACHAGGRGFEPPKPQIEIAGGTRSSMRGERMRAGNEKVSAGGG